MAIVWFIVMVLALLTTIAGAVVSYESLTSEPIIATAFMTPFVTLIGFCLTVSAARKMICEAEENYKRHCTRM